MRCEFAPELSIPVMASGSSVNFSVKSFSSCILSSIVTWWRWYALREGLPSGELLLGVAAAVHSNHNVTVFERCKFPKSLLRRPLHCSVFFRRRVAAWYQFQSPVVLCESVGYSGAQKCFLGVSNLNDSHTALDPDELHVPGVQLFVVHPFLRSSQHESTA